MNEINPMDQEVKIESRNSTTMDEKKLLGFSGSMTHARIQIVKNLNQKGDDIDLDNEMNSKKNSQAFELPPNKFIKGQ